MSAVVFGGNFEIRWREPVWIRIGNGVPEPVRVPKLALNYLTFRWPDSGGSGLREALEQCRKTLRKETEAGVSRAAFVSAARAARVLL
jgi:hypothetical protein